MRDDALVQRGLALAGVARAAALGRGASDGVEVVVSHTPGPWNVDQETILRVGDCVLSHQIWGETRVGFVESQNVSLSEADANARLIAAAPDLLAECKRVVAWFEAVKQNQHEQLVAGQSLESASRNWETMTAPSLDLQPTMDTIAKAEGR